MQQHIIQYNLKDTHTKAAHSFLTSARGRVTSRSYHTHYKLFMKAQMDGDCSAIFGTLFQSFAPRNDKDFWPLVEVFFGIFKSVVLFRRAISSCIFKIE